jgi:hypothetical protein
MEPEGSLPHSQVPATCLYSEQNIGPFLDRTDKLSRNVRKKLPLYAA